MKIIKAAKFKVLEDKGFSLAEVMIASAIMGGVVLLGYSLLSNFNSFTKKEAIKFENISEYSLLVKEMSKIVESADLSRSYLNFPVPVMCSSALNSNLPCVRAIDGASQWGPVNQSQLPDNLRGAGKCVQFFQDAMGKLGEKSAFPGLPNWNKEITKYFDPFNFSSQGTELYATWPLVDEDSMPFYLLKRGEEVLTLQMDLSSVVTPSTHAYFYSNYEHSRLKALIGKALLVYSGVYPEQYTVKAIETVEPCESLACVSAAGAAYGIAIDASNVDTRIKDRAKLFKVKLVSIPESDPFFTLNNKYESLPSDCKSDWDSKRQSSKFFFFPSKAMSVTTEADGTDLDANMLNFHGNDIKIQKLAHYYNNKLNGSSIIGEHVDRGLVNAVPIDVVRYRIVPGSKEGQKTLISEMYNLFEFSSLTPFKRKVLLQNLKAPVFFTRKIGSDEFGTWYNPQ